MRGKNYFASLLIWKQKSFITVQAKFCRNNYSQKSQIYRRVHKFQATGAVNNLNNKAENLRFGWKLTIRCPDNVDAVRYSVVQKNPFEEIPKN